MSLDKGIAHGKEHRKPYRHARTRSCSCNGGCAYCLSNRMHSTKRRALKGTGK